MTETTHEGTSSTESLTEEDYENVPAYTGDDEVSPAINGVPEEVARQEYLDSEAEREAEEKAEEDEGLIEGIVEDSALPEDVKEVLNMEVSEAFRELFDNDEDEKK